MQKGELRGRSYISVENKNAIVSFRNYLLFKNGRLTFLKCISIQYLSVHQNQFVHIVQCPDENLGNYSACFVFGDIVA